MNKAVPWNINGVGFDAREAAREAARRQGKSLGEWLDGVIADHAAELGVEERDIRGQDRIDAVTSRLERLGARAAAGARAGRASPRGVEPDRDRARRDRDDTARSVARSRVDVRDDEDDAYETPRVRRSDVTRPTDRFREERRFQRAPIAIEETELLLEEAIDAMERRAIRTERKTDEALASFAKIIESTETKRDGEREMFTALSQKLSDIEARMANRATDDSYRPIKGALARLEARLDSFGRRPQPEIGPEPSISASMARPPRADPSIHRLEEKLNSILEAMQTSAVATSTASAASRARATEPASTMPAPAPVSPIHQRLGDAIADIAHRQRSLDSGIRDRDDRSVAPTRAAPIRAAATPREEDPAIGGLKSEIAGLAAKMDELRRDVISRVAKTDDAGTRIEDLRGEIAKMASLMREVAPRASLQGQIGQMTSALEDMRRDVASRDEERRRGESALAEVASRTDLDGLKSEIAAISKTLGALAPPAKLGGLEDAIRTLTDRVDRSRSAEIGETALRPLEEAIGGLRQWMANVDPRATIGGLEREMRSIGDKLDDLNGVDTSALSRLQDQTEEIRKLVAAAVDNPLAVDRIERQVATLADKIERQPTPSARDDKTFQAAADEIRALLENPPGIALFDKIERRLEALTAKVDQAVDEASGARKVAELSKRHFDDVQEQLASRLIGDPAQGSPDVRSLERLVRDLSTKIEAVRAPDAGGPAIEALQEQIFRLSNRLERSDGELSALSAIERSMRELFAHLEDTRASVETSAARVAREAMESALASGPRADPRTARELAALKAIQEEADHRTHDTLNAVHEALEKVVDRLSVMENDIATVRQPALEPRQAAPRIAVAPAEDRPAPTNPTSRDSRRSDLSDLMLEDTDPLDAPLAPRKATERVRAPSFAPPRAVPNDFDDTAGRSDFIAAARRAARAAQTDPSVVAMKRPNAPLAPEDVRAGLMARSRDYVASHKKPVLLGIAALLVMLGTIAVMGTLKSGDGPALVAAATTDPVPVKAAAAVPRAIAPAASSATLADLTPSALPKALPPSVKEAIAGSDPVTTGSIPRLPSFAAQSVAPAAAVAPSGPLKEMADAGNPGAQYEVASRYAEGRQLTKDFALAAIWYERAAQQGLAPAQYKLASLYEKGLGVARDKIKAKFWYIKAADAGNPRAMHNLAVLVADGDGKPDYASAVIWFRKAAEYGIHDSQYNLGILLARGLGTSQSLVQSYQWFAVAARQNDTDAATKRDEVAAKLNPTDLSVAKALAASFRPKTADVAVMEIDPPAGGWDGASSPSLVKSARPKLSSL